MSDRLVVMWPLDPDADHRGAIREASHQIADMAVEHGVRLRGGKFTVVAPDGCAGRKGWLLHYEAVAVRSVTVDPKASPCEPYLPTQVVIRDGIGDYQHAGRGRTPAERPEAGRRIAALRTAGATAADIADLVGCSERTVERIAFDSRQRETVTG